MVFLILVFLINILIDDRNKAHKHTDGKHTKGAVKAIKKVAI